MAGFQKKTGLGRGLGALLEDTAQLPETPVAEREQRKAEEPAASKGVNDFDHISLADITTNPYQPRTEFDQVALHELADSIKVQGLIQPITVRADGSGKYQLISGERRFRASKIAGLEKIPAYIRAVNDQQMLELGLIENIQRENLNAMEVAISFQRMLDECGLKQEQLGERVGKNRSTINNYLRLLKLPAEIQAALRDQKISMGHGRALLSVDGEEEQLWLFNQILEKELSVRKVEELSRVMARGGVLPAEQQAKPKGSATHARLQEELGNKFRAKVRVNVRDKGRGSIEIPFVSEEDLNRIVALLDW